MRIKYGSYLVLPLKYNEGEPKLKVLEHEYEKFRLETPDLNENVKRMLNEEGYQGVGKAHRIPREKLDAHLCGGDSPVQCRVTSEGTEYSFELLDSYVYTFHTQVAFLCLGISFSKMEALYAICNPGFADNASRFCWLDKGGTEHFFQLGSWLEQLCADWGLQKFYDGPSSLLLEGYTYILALTDKRFETLEELRRITFNLHKMQDPNFPVEDDSEADIRYVYGVKNNALHSYRWGCCVASQTISYAVADEEMDLCREMATQAADGLPIVLLALYGQYTCLRFTELIAQPKALGNKTIQKLKQVMLRFQAFGTIPPANLSRWNNVKQIYAYLLEVCDTANAVQDISVKVDILTEQQQEIQNRRSSRVLNLVTIFGVVGIIASIQSIVQLLTDGSHLMWVVTLLTTAVMCLCFGLALRRK